MDHIDKLASGNQPIILVDTSYYSFYRFFAINCWWQKARQDSEVDLSTVTIPLEGSEEKFGEFITKYKKVFIENLFSIAKEFILKKKRGSKGISVIDRVVLARDCPRDTIWRNEFYPEYKINRADKDQNHRGVKMADIGQVFKFTYKHILPELIDLGVRVFKCDKAEADDIIACLHRYIRDKNKDVEIFIIASDHDYMQLLDEKTFIYTANLKLLNEKSKYFNKEIARIDKSLYNYNVQIDDMILDINIDLLCKILCGDKSDNIKPVCKISKKKLEQIVNDKNELLKLLDNKNNKDKFLLNKKLVDFKSIPSTIADFFT